MNDPAHATRILVIDDEAGFTRLLKLTLEKMGNYSVTELNDPTLARETARRFRPDIVLLDIMMPWADGGDVASQLRADALLQRVPIVFLTAIVSGKEAAPGDEIGGFPFVSKPVNLDELIACIEQQLRRS